MDKMKELGYEEYLHELGVWVEKNNKIY
jgi:hypothetical protein